MKKVIVFSAVLFFLTILTNCSDGGKSTKTIVGTWECRIEFDEAAVTASGVKGSTSILVINEDKTCLEKSSVGEFHRTWKTNGSDFCFKTEEIEACYKYVLNGDLLTLDFEGLKFEYKRIK